MGTLDGAMTRTDLDEQSPPTLAPTGTRHGRGVLRKIVLALAGTLAVVVLTLLILWVPGQIYGVHGSLISYGNIQDSSIDVTVEVVRPADASVTCTVAAVGEGMFDVGASRIAIPADGERRVQVSTTVPTAQRALGARLIGCTEN